MKYSRAWTVEKSLGPIVEPKALENVQELLDESFPEESDLKMIPTFAKDLSKDFSKDLSKEYKNISSADSADLIIDSNEYFYIHKNTFVSILVAIIGFIFICYISAQNNRIIQLEKKVFNIQTIDY